VKIDEVFRCFRHLREANQNTGLRVEAVQKFGGGQKGDSWCCWLLTMVIDLYWCGHLEKPESEIPIRRLGACDDVLDICLKKNWMAIRPVNDGGDYIYFYVRNPEGKTAKEMDAYHIGLVTDAKQTDFRGISGNTSEDGLSSNGNGVYERYIKYTPKMKFAKIPL
jgi:hypothetical protein